MCLPSASAATAFLIALARARTSNAAHTRNRDEQHANMMPVIGRAFRRFWAGSPKIERITVMSEKSVRVRKTVVEADKW